MADTILGGANTNTDGQGAPTPEQNPVPNPTPETNPTTPTPEGNTTPTTEPPTVPEQYDFSSLGEVDATIAEEFSGILRGMGLGQEQAQSLAQYGITYAQNALKAQEEAQQAQLVEQSNAWAEATKAELGPKFQETLNSAGIAMDYLEKEIPNLRELVSENGLGNRVEFVKLFAIVGEAIREDKGKGGNRLPNGELDAASIMYPNMK